MGVLVIIFQIKFILVVSDFFKGVFVMIDFAKYIKLIQSGSIDVEAMFARGKFVQLPQVEEIAAIERMIKLRSEVTCSAGLRLPEKSEIENWKHKPTVITLMNRYLWTRKDAELRFTDFMKYAYSITRLRLISQNANDSKGPITMFDFPMFSFQLDEVWHSYLLYTPDYFNMCKSLFGVDYIHHIPGNASFNEKKSEYIKIWSNQLNGLAADWGNDYVERIFQYEIDVLDINFGLA